VKSSWYSASVPETGTCGGAVAVLAAAGGAEVAGIGDAAGASSVLGMLPHPVEVTMKTRIANIHTERKICWSLMDLFLHLT